MEYKFTLKKDALLMMAVMSVAMETHFHVFLLKYKYFEYLFEGTLVEKKFATTFPQYVL